MNDEKPGWMMTVTLESKRFMLELYIRYLDRSYLNLDFMTAQNA